MSAENMELIDAAIKHAEGAKAVAIANINVYRRNPAGIGEHSDIVEAIQSELDKIAAADDRIDAATKYFCLTGWHPDK
jgi:hypothetical protein|tara:strand:- start:10 stop:243 length:234 start_codon:yes stop_codon:yes gene_type:complete